MKKFLVFDFTRNASVQEVQENHRFTDNETVFELKEGHSNFALRYALKGDGYIDAYPEKTDSEVIQFLQDWEEANTVNLEKAVK